MTLRAYQSRLDGIRDALTLFQSPEILPWVEGEDLWVVPRNPLSLFGPGRLSPNAPVLFSSATVQPAYTAQVLSITRYASSQVGVPFNLAQQVLIYEPTAPADEVEQVMSIISATFWEGVDVPGESLSCVVIVRLPFPAHDPLIAERRAQAVGREEDPMLAVDLPEMLVKLKQGA